MDICRDTFSDLIHHYLSNNVLVLRSMTWMYPPQPQTLPPFLPLLFPGAQSTAYSHIKTDHSCKRYNQRSPGPLLFPPVIPRIFSEMCYNPAVPYSESSSGPVLMVIHIEFLFQPEQSLFIQLPPRQKPKYPLRMQGLSFLLQFPVSLSSKQAPGSTDRTVITPVDKMFCGNVAA